MASSPAARQPGTGASADVLVDHRQHPYRSLVVVFTVWKAALLALAVVSRLAGPAYDTSGDLLEVASASGGNAMPDHGPLAVGHAIPSGSIVSRLTSWDAIYFVQLSRRGHVYEQEWAFGTGLPIAVSLIRDAITSIVGIDVSAPIVAGVYVHAAHLLSVLVLYKLGCQLWLGDRGRTVAFAAACLHVLSPAGLFLSAPYAESSCALFSFAGYVAFVAARKRDAASAAPSLAGDLLRLVAGVYFGIATAFRTNGLLNGVVFAYEAVVDGLAILQQPSVSRLRRLVFLVAGGVSVAAGSVIPQTVAYFQFCTAPSGIPGETLRPWCSARVPSIYTFVQEHYWGSGRLFNYWTLSNLPLFLLAGPMLYIMARSARDIWADVRVHQRAVAARKITDGKDGFLQPVYASDPSLAPVIQCMAASQLILAVMAFTSYHVQIISRLSSTYPIWYWWLAQNLAGGARTSLARAFVVFMVMYASIQGILFASFLPPA